jgi:hypothetical protein
MLREAPEIEVATVAKNSREQVRVRLNEYRGNHYVDLRVFTPFGMTTPRARQKRV